MTGALVTRRAFVGLLTALTAAGIGLGADQRDENGPAGDSVEGAMWRMELASRARKGKKRMAVFRVADDVLYQKEKPGPKAEEKVVGKNRPSARRETTMEFDKLRVFEPGERRESAEMLSGSAKLEMDEFGKWHGRLVDGDGYRWDVKLTRFKE